MLTHQTQNSYICYITCITYSAVLKFSCDLLSLSSLFVFSFLLLQFHPLNSKASQIITIHDRSQVESLRVILSSKIFQASCRRSFMLRLCCGSVTGYHIAIQLSGHTSWSLDEKCNVTWTKRVDVHVHRYKISQHNGSRMIYIIVFNLSKLIKHTKPNDQLHNTKHKEQHSQASKSRNQNTKQRKHKNTIEENLEGAFKLWHIDDSKVEITIWQC